MSIVWNYNFSEEDYNIITWSYNILESISLEFQASRKINNSKKKCVIVEFVTTAEQIDYRYMIRQLELFCEPINQLAFPRELGKQASPGGMLSRGVSRNNVRFVHWLPTLEYVELKYLISNLEIYIATVYIGWSLKNLILYLMCDYVDRLKL